MIKDRTTQTLAATLAMVPLIAGAVVGLLTLLVSGLQCDESCTGEGWQHTAGAWQFAVIVISGVLAALVCAPTEQDPGSDPAGV